MELENLKMTVKSSNLTREVVEDFATNRNYNGTKIFPNLHRVLFRNDEFNTETFWGLVLFYNFIQRAMDTNLERPSYDDYYNGWKIFIELYKLLKPKTCLFVGTTYANSLHHAINGTDLGADEINWEDWISNAYAKSSKLFHGDLETDLVFIRHTSQMFSWDKWNAFLSNRIGGQLEWLKKEVG